MKPISGYVSVLLIAILFIFSSPSPSYAGLTPEEQSLADASLNTPTTFIIPISLRSAVMARAQAMISTWNEMEKYPAVMKLQTVTDYITETYSPGEPGNYGLKVTCVDLPQGSQFHVVGEYNGSNPFGRSQQEFEALRRARMLSYILQNYANTLAVTPAQSPAVVTQETLPLPEEFELFLKLMRAQLTDGNYDAALSTLANLKVAIEAKSKQSGLEPKVKAPHSESGTATYVSPGATPLDKVLSGLAVPSKARFHFSDGTTISGIITARSATSFLIETAQGTINVAFANIASVEMLTERSPK